jgi:hypothetical protein
MMTVAAVLSAGCCVSLFAFPLALWQRRQQLFNRVRLLPLSDGPFGDDPTCFIEHFAPRALLAAFALDLCDILAVLGAQLYLQLPLFDARRLLDRVAATDRHAALAASLWLALFTAPVSGFALWAAVRVHLLPRSARSVCPSLRAHERQLSLLRTVALVLLRDAIYGSTLLIVVVLLAEWHSLLSSTVAVLAATSLSHAVDTAAVDSSARWWFGFVPRLARQLCVGVSLSSWILLTSRALGDGDGVH